MREISKLIAKTLLGWLAVWLLMYGVAMANVWLKQH